MNHAIKLKGNAVIRMMMCVLGIVASIAAADTRPTIAVLPFVGVGVDSTSALSISNALTNELIENGKLRVLERSQINDILREQGFQQSGACDASECAVEVGKLLSVKLIVLGSIGKIGEAYSISVRSVDVETGEAKSSFQSIKRGSIDSIIINILPALSSAVSESKSYYSVPERPSSTREEYRNSVTASSTFPLNQLLDNSKIVVELGYTRNSFAWKHLAIQVGGGAKFIHYDFSIWREDYGSATKFSYSSLIYKAYFGAEAELDRLHGGIGVSGDMDGDNSKGPYYLFCDAQFDIGFRLARWLDVGLKSEVALIPLRERYGFGSEYFSKDYYYRDAECYLSYRF